MSYERLLLPTCGRWGAGSRGGLPVQQHSGKGASVCKGKRKQKNTKSLPGPKKLKKQGSQQIKYSESHAAFGGRNKKVSMTQDNQPHHNKNTGNTIALNFVE